VVVVQVVTFFAPELFHAIETMVYFLAIGEVCRVRVATRLDGDETTEHPWVLGRMREFGGVEITHCDEPAESDIFIFQLIRHGRISKELAPWRARAQSAAYLWPSEGPPNRGDWWRETIRSFPHYLWARKIALRPYIHPQLFANPKWRQSSFEPIGADVPRRWRIGFLGNRQPAERTARLVQCKEALIGVDRVQWHEYGDGATNEPRGIAPMEYVTALSEMDFCISPPGWSWYTHRTIEALVRGSIPIIEDPQVYGLALRDNETCIIARADNWGATVRRALKISEADILRMRRNVIALRERQLLPKRVIEHFRSELFPYRKSEVGVR
jgi:hypothetical protein